MCISETPSCTNWEPYTQSKGWRLSAGDGAKTIYAWFRDSLNNATVIPCMAMITLDTSAPTTTVDPTGGIYGSAQQVYLSTSEAATIYFTIDGTDPNESSNVYSTPITISDTGILKFFARDPSGNAETIKAETYSISPCTTTISGPSAGVHHAADYVINIGGAGIVAYKYQLDQGAWSSEMLSGIPIVLEGLVRGHHTLSVVGKNTGGLWQFESHATILDWEIVFTGDINNDGDVGLRDAIMAMQVISQIVPAASVNKHADVDGDGKIGLSEVIFILQKIGAMR
jgi:hypothetical protein